MLLYALRDFPLQPRYIPGNDIPELLAGNIRRVRNKQFVLVKIGAGFIPLTAHQFLGNAFDTSCLNSSHRMLERWPLYKDCGHLWDYYIVIILERFINGGVAS